MDRGTADLSEFKNWFERQLSSYSYSVEKIALNDMSGWSFDQSGNMSHSSGRFFTIEGIEVATDNAPVESWHQPIINQQEIGILGILVKRFRGNRYFLMQAKMEPGNINILQLSPTVQATRSNYTRVHKGRSVPYLEYFMYPRNNEILSDVLQLEQGSWFLHKRNRNMIIETEGEVDVLEGFRWVSESEMSDLLVIDNLVNMDSRTVLSDYQPERAPNGIDAHLRGPVSRSEASESGTHTINAIRSWFTESKTKHSLRRNMIPLEQVENWVWEDAQIKHKNGIFFNIVGVNVSAGEREVASWSQPMIEPRRRGLVGLIIKNIGGVLHLLMGAHTQAGTFDVVEIGATVQCSPENYSDDEHQRPPYLDYFTDAPSSKVWADVFHSEEGGRFYHATNRYMIVETSDEEHATKLTDDSDYIWMTIAQLSSWVRNSASVNVEARNLLTCLRFLGRGSASTAAK